MSVRIAFMGDTLLGGQAENILRLKGYDYALEPLAPILRRVDLVVANHEGAVTADGEPLNKVDNEGQRRWWYRAHPEALAALREYGVMLLGLANNHVMDFGSYGLESTLRAAEEAGMMLTGAGLNEEEARRPAVINCAGLRIGFVSRMQHYKLCESDGVYAGSDRPGVAKLDEAQLDADFDTCGPLDLRITLAHWGMNYEAVTDRQRNGARKLSHTSTDLVVGHHAHIAQQVTSEYKIPVLFGLGNGVYGARGRFRSRRMPALGLIAVIEIGKSALIEKLELYLLKVDSRRNNFRPEVARGYAAQTFLKTLLDEPDQWISPDGTGLHRVLARH